LIYNVVYHEYTYPAESTKAYSPKAHAQGLKSVPIPISIAIVIAIAIAIVENVVAQWNRIH
jgi:hypothetical protein